MQYFLLAKIIKSWSSTILKDLISGSGMTTKGFPPYFSNFASISPKVLETFDVLICYI